MAPKGTFVDSQPGDVIDLLDKKIVGKGVVGKLFGRIDAVVVRPSWAGGGPKESMRKATDAGVPQARISAGGLMHPGPSVFLIPGGTMSQDEANAKVMAANIGAPQSRVSFGQHLYEFSETATGKELLDFAIAALKALGADAADGKWEYIAQVKDD